MTEDEMVGRHYRLNGHEFEQTSGDGERQGSLTCCSLWDHKESDMTEQLDNNKKLFLKKPALSLMDFLFLLSLVLEEASS